MPINNSHLIGTLEVYDEQIVCANRIMDVFKAYEGPPILIAQMQQGKTGASIAVIEMFIKHCEFTSKSYEIFYVVNIADNVLRDQTEDRLRKSGYLSKVKVLHHAALSETRPDSSKSVRLIIIDECHVALEKSSSASAKPFHEFMKKCGIKYGQPISDWENKENFVLSVSATPYAHVIKTKIDEHAFKPITLEINENYYSLQKMNEAGRLKSAKATTQNGKVTPFFVYRMVEFLQDCKENGNGHMVIRSVGSGPEAIKDHIESFHPEVDVKIFESKSENIGQIDSMLGGQYPKPSVAIIRGSLRAGKTLTTTKYIKMWIEVPSSKADTMCQSVGRCLGFEKEPGTNEGPLNRRFSDKFPVYCNIKEINEAIAFYDNYGCVPSGIRNAKTDSHVADYDIKVYNSEAEINSAFPGLSIRTCSKNFDNSLADNIIQKKLIGGGGGGEGTTLFHMDAPNENFRLDWEAMDDQYKGKYVAMILKGDKTDRSYDNKIKKNCILA